MPFYTRALTPSDYGILDTLVVGIALIQVFFNVGADSASARYFYMAKTEEEKGKILFNTLVFRLIVIIPSLIIAIFSAQISEALFGSPKYQWVIFLSCMILPLNLFFSEQEHIYRYYFEPWKFNIVNITKIISHLCLGISLVVIYKKGILGAQIATLSSSILLFFVSFLLFTKKRYTYRFSWYWAKKMLKYGMPLVPAGIAAWFYISSDRYFLLHYQNTTEIGLYAVGNKLSQALQILAISVQMSWGPILISVYERDKTEEKLETKNLYSQGWRLFLVVSLTLSLFLSIFGIELAKILTRPAYYMCVLAIPFLTLSKVCSQSVQMTGIGINLAEKTKHFAWILPLVAGVNVGLNFFFVPKFSFVGAAFTTLVASLVYLLFSYNLSQKYFPVDTKIRNVLLYSSFIATLAIFFPFAQVKYNLPISFPLKAAVFFIALTLPFLTGMISTSIPQKIYLSLKEKIL